MSENEITQSKMMDPVKLTSVADHIQGGMIEGLLLGVGIPVYRKALESGGVMQIYMGYSIFGEELYVDRDDYERALEIVELLELCEDEDAWLEEDWSVEEGFEEELAEEANGEACNNKAAVVAIMRKLIMGYLALVFVFLVLKVCGLIYYLIISLH